MVVIQKLNMPLAIKTPDEEGQTESSSSSRRRNSIRKHSRYYSSSKKTFRYYLKHSYGSTQTVYVMPRKKTTVKAAVAIPTIREDSNQIHIHESMVDFISGRYAYRPFLDVFRSGMFGLDFLTNNDAYLENDFIYSDYEEDETYPHAVPDGRLRPHPRIRQLSEEEAEKHARELIEEERRKEKTVRNKRKKMRKKEKKRLEKGNGDKAILPEEEQAGADSSEDREENSIIDNNNNAEANGFPESDRTQNGTEEVGCDERSGNNTNNKEENNVEHEEEEDLNSSSSYFPASEPMPQATRKQRPARARTKDQTKSVEVKKPSKEGKPKAAEKPEPHEQDTFQEFAQKSRELAGIGHGLASSGQFETAVKYYTDAIKYNPKEFRLFGNRSLCYERMQQHEMALRDAELALCMEPNWIKGLFRKGKALCGLKRYYEASLIYKEVLLLESSSDEAAQALKRAQTLHLMEMGFTWSQSCEALRTHSSLEDAVESLFGDSNPGPRDASASGPSADPPLVQEEEDDGEGEWILLQTNRPRTQKMGDSDAFTLNGSKSNSPNPFSRHSGKPELHPIWVGSLAPTVTYTSLHELFSRAGAVYSIKMLLEQQCAFVNYTRQEESDRAVQCLNGMILEGAPLLVRYPDKIHTGLGMSKSAITDPSRPGSVGKECFFWRTVGCSRLDCTYKHDPKHKSIDRNKFTS